MGYYNPGRECLLRGTNWDFKSDSFSFVLKGLIIQCVPLTTEPGISLIILTPMKILQWNLNRSTFVVWEMKRNVSVVRFKCRCNILISGRIIKEMPGSVASGTHCICLFVLVDLQIFEFWYRAVLRIILIGSLDLKRWKYLSIYQFTRCHIEEYLNLLLLILSHSFRL